MWRFTCCTGHRAMFYLCNAREARSSQYMPSTRRLRTNSSDRLSRPKLRGTCTWCTLLGIESHSLQGRRRIAVARPPDPGLLAG